MEFATTQSYCPRRTRKRKTSAPGSFVPNPVASSTAPKGRAKTPIRCPVLLPKRCHFDHVGGAVAPLSSPTADLRGGDPLSGSSVRQLQIHMTVDDRAPARILRLLLTNSQYVQGWSPPSIAAFVAMPLIAADFLADGLQLTKQLRSNRWLGRALFSCVVVQYRTSRAGNLGSVGNPGNI